MTAGAAVAWAPARPATREVPAMTADAADLSRFADDGNPHAGTDPAG